MMKEKQNIDRLFQEKFKDFKAQPSDKVWENIAFAKAQKQKRALAPIWWKLGGAAAVVALLILLGTTLLNNQPTANTPTTIVNIENNSESTPPSVVLKAEPDDSKESDGKQKENLDGLDESIITQNEQSQYNKTFVENNYSNATVVSSNGQKENEVKSYSVRGEDDHSWSFDGYANPKEAVVSKNPKAKNSIASESKINGKDFNQGDSPIMDQESAVAQETNQKTDEKGKSLVEEAKKIEAQKEEEAVAFTGQEEKEFKNRWNVGAIAAPVYYGDFGGSGIDPEFKDNTKSSDLNLSYGVQISYAVSPKLKVRAGVSNLDLSYNTQDIAVSPDIAARQLKGVNYSRTGRFLRIADSNPNVQQLAQSSDFQASNTFSNGELQQRLGYIEVPVEAVYTVSDKRLGVDIIGGVSTLFLNDNEIIVEAGGLRNNIGSSSSANEVSFTSNLGIGVHYKLTEKVKINLEPSFKYQLNAFDESAGDFKPYFIGLYTGVNYRF